MNKFAEHMRWLLPEVRKRKDKQDSTLYGLLVTIGIVLEELKSAILTTRLRKYFLVRDADNPYYDSELRTTDLDMHALDRGLRRLQGENNASLLDRISTLAHRNQFLGTKAGMKYLIEELFGLNCERIVEYYADDQVWIILTDVSQSAEVENNVTHVFSEADSDNFEAFRQTRIYSEGDLSLAFHFWIHISYQQGMEIDEEVILETINAQKPAHTRAVVHFTEIEVPVT